ncbi:MAG: type II toxin-antitoxin system RelE/ParE family toxin [Candidatus Omnitrophota bacterium]
MEKYKIVIKKSAVKELESIPKKDLQRIVKRIQMISESPKPNNSQKLSQREEYRIRQGDYRIIYAVINEKETVEIIKIGHRREIYR